MQFHVTIRTPRTVVFDADISSVRVPTHSGHVGLRPQAEKTVLAVEPGLLVLRNDTQFQYAGTAGGLARCDGTGVTLLTPLAVIGDRLEDVTQELERILAEPSTEMDVRRTLSRLELRMMRELREGDAPGDAPRGAQV